jgi:hypothetical protein
MALARGLTRRTEKGRAFGRKDFSFFRRDGALTRMPRAPFLGRCTPASNGRGASNALGGMGGVGHDEDGDPIMSCVVEDIDVPDGGVDALDVPYVRYRTDRNLRTD